MSELCTTPECTRRFLARGLCNRHYKQAQATGVLETHPKRGRRQPDPCTINGCDKAQKARGWCASHYWRWRHNGDPERLVRKTYDTCTLDDCDKPYASGGFCAMHRARMERRGYLDDALYSHGSPRQRFWRFVEAGEQHNCWIWAGSVNNHGYGKVGPYYAHRLSYEIHRGEIPTGLEVMHACDNPPCVNPEHLSVGTHAENMADMARKGRAFRGRATVSA